MTPSVPKYQTGFTLIELLAVMAIVAVLAGIVAVAVSGTGETSRDTQTKQDATTVESAAADFFADQEEAEVLSPKTVQVLGISGIKQVTSSRWPEGPISDRYSIVFTTTVTGGTVNGLLLLTGDDSTTPITPKQLLENFNAIDFDTLIADGFLAVEPDGATELSDNTYDNYLWLLQRTTASGGSSEGAERQVAVFKLVSVQKIENSNQVDLTYVQVVGEISQVSTAPANSPPVAFGDNIVTDHNTPVQIILDGTDADGDALTFEIVIGSGPTDGSLDEASLNEAIPSVLYIPDSIFSGFDSFDFSVSDDEFTITATVTIFVQPPPVTVVVPNSLATVEGNQNHTIPFSRSAAFSQRYQQVYAASQFGALSQPHLITRIAFRPDGPQTSAFNTTFAEIQINFSTTSKEPLFTSTPPGPDALTATFADNVGEDDTVVFAKGPLTLTSSFAAPQTGPKDFDIVIPLQVPFLYDPTAGNLLLDIRIFSGGFTTSFDMEAFGLGAPTSRAFSSIDSLSVDDLSGQVDAGALVTQFTAVPAGN